MRELYNVAESVGGNSSGETRRIVLQKMRSTDQSIFLGNLKRLMVVKAK